MGAHVSKLADFVAGRRGSISALTLAVILTVPVAIAVTHEGFPVSTADLDPRTVWVSNSEEALAGRLSKPIKELDGAVQPKSTEFDVFQDAQAVFVLSETDEGTKLARIDPAFTVMEGEATVPAGSHVSYGSGVLAVVRPTDGGLWVLRADQPIDLSGDPMLVLGEDASVTVSITGTVFAYSSEQKKLYTITVGESSAGTRDFSTPDGELEFSAVGDRVVGLVRGTTTLVMPDGSLRELPEKGLRLQQPGPDAESVLVSTGSGLLEVPFAAGEPESIDGGLAAPSTQPSDAAAPVRLGECVYAAWSNAQRELHQCGDAEPIANDIDRPTAGDPLVFRVNRSVIVLNNIRNGDSWVVEDEVTLVDNWDDVKPEEVEATSEGEEEASEDNFEEQIATRTEDNRTPVAVPDSLGARPERATVLPVLDNDNDPDGDVLTITDFEAVPESQGVIEIIDGGRALQFTSAPGANGTVTTRYDVTDGRPSGTATAAVDIAVSETANQAPVQQRVTSVNVEQSQSISYNVLADWRDPDGDEVFLKSASASSGDTVRRTPDGIVNFTSTTTELGQKTIDVVVSDGTNEVPGTLIFTVKEAGTLVPLGVPDFATTFVGKPVTVKPLENDRSPSGQPLTLNAVEPFDADLGVPRPTSAGEFTFVAPKAGTYYFKYTVGAGSATSVGLVRIDVSEDPENPLPPIAVRDVAYLRPNQSIDLGVLQNDLSPSGRIIGIQSISVPLEATSITVEVLKNTLLRVSSSEALEGFKAFTFEYTISDGVAEAKASVVVVPVPPLANNQPPITRDDSVTVRVGDVVSVQVLDNDVHPDGAVMRVSPDFVAPLADGEGFAFVSDGVVRYQAPSEAGTYSLRYTVLDDFGQEATALITFTVNALDDSTNENPTPRNLEARVFAGTAFRIDIPLDSIDPNGDSTQLLGVTSSPALGQITDTGEDWFRYEAYSDAAGTDQFTYQVVDAFGAVGQATVRIGVLPRPSDALPPSAVNDSVSLRPDRTGTVNVLANDSDPSGFALALGSELDPDPGIEASVVNSQVVVTAAEEGAYSIGYTVSNGHGGTAKGYILVTVDKNAKLSPPTAIDHFVAIADVAGQSSVKVDPLEGAGNPSGLVSELLVGVVGPGADYATIADDGTVSIELGDTRRVIAYTLTSADDLSSTAFITVPRRVGADWAPPPFLKPDLPEQSIASGQTGTWNLSDILVVPSGRAPILVDADGVSASRSNGASSYVDTDTISFTSEAGYSGPASVTFHVTDGGTGADPRGNDGFVTLPITVTGPDPAAIAPVFASRTMNVVVLESATLDLRAATEHPSQDVKNSLQFDQLSPAPDTMRAAISGSTLTIEALTGSTGATATLTFRISGSGIEPIIATVNVIVVSTTRPPPAPADDQWLLGAPQTTTQDPLANDVNPFPETPMTIVNIEQQENGAPTIARPSISGGVIRIVPSPGWIGTYVFRYTVRDATGDTKRDRSALAVFVFRAVPGNQPASPAPPTSDDTVATVTMNSQPAPNNADISTYRVTNTTTGSYQDCSSLGCTFTFPGLTNGVTYSFVGQAQNVMGWGQTWSIGSTTPLGTPPVPAVSLGVNYDGILLNWSAPAGTAGRVDTVEWLVNTGPSGSSGPGGSPVFVSGTTGTAYSFQARSCNAGENRTRCSAWSPPSNVVVPPPRPSMTFFATHDANVPAQSDSGWRVHVQFADVLPGQSYSICGSSSPEVLWWHAFASPTGQSSLKLVQGPTTCGTITIDSTYTNEPFGWVIPNAKKGQWVTVSIPELGIDQGFTIPN